MRGSWRWWLQRGGCTHRSSSCLPSARDGGRLGGVHQWSHYCCPMLRLVICSIICRFQIFTWIVVDLWTWSGIQCPLGPGPPHEGCEQVCRIAGCFAWLWWSWSYWKRYPWWCFCTGASTDSYVVNLYHCWCYFDWQDFACCTTSAYVAYKEDHRHKKIKGYIMFDASII